MVRIACLFAVCMACSSAKPPGEGRRPSGFLSGAGRLTSSKYTFDVELGHTFGQEPLTSAARKAEQVPSATAVQRSKNP